MKCPTLTITVFLFVFLISRFLLTHPQDQHLDRLGNILRSLRESSSKVDRKVAAAHQQPRTPIERRESAANRSYAFPTPESSSAVNDSRYETAVHRNNPRNSSIADPRFQRPPPSSPEMSPKTANRRTTRYHSDDGAGLSSSVRAERATTADVDPRFRRPLPSSPEMSPKAANRRVTHYHTDDCVAPSSSVRSERATTADSSLYGPPRRRISRQDHRHEAQQGRSNDSSENWARFDASSSINGMPPPPPPLLPHSARPHDFEDSAEIVRESGSSPDANTSARIVGKSGRLELVAKLCRERVVRTWWRGVSCGVCFAAGAWVREGYETFGVGLALAAVLSEMVIHEFIIDGG